MALLRDKYTFKITFDQSDQEYSDYGAEAILSILVKAAKKAYNMNFGGQFSKKKTIREIAMATGLPYELGVQFPEQYGFKTFPIRHGRKKEDEKTTQSSARERYTSQLVDYLDGCLLVYGYKFNDDGYEKVSNMISEIIDNSERHSGIPDWWVGGYMRKLNNSEFSDVHLTVFNFGKSIFESLNELPDNSMLRKNIESVVKKHYSKGLFSDEWTKEQLWTLYALQEGVSVKNIEETKIGINGRGTVRLIDFFQKLGQSGNPDYKPKMCLISGKTMVYHDQQYSLKRQQTLSGENRQIIAFNSVNSLEKKPDKKNIRKLNLHFPGTLFSFRFYLNDRYLSQLGERHE